jgi:hypothetical protein
MIRWCCLLLLVAAVAGCSGFTPFPASPRGLSAHEKNPGTRVAICYNGLKTPPEEVQKLGLEQCQNYGGATAERIDTDYRMDDCPLMTPARATFLCKTAK